MAVKCIFTARIHPVKWKTENVKATVKWKMPIFKGTRGGGKSSEPEVVTLIPNYCENCLFDS